MGSEYTWAVHEDGGGRRFVLQRPSGYTGTVTVEGERVSARLWKEREAKPAIDEPPRALPAGDVDRAVSECQRRIERRLTELESGHS